MAGSLKVFQRPGQRTWTWRFYAGVVDGRKVQPSKGGFRTKAEATKAGTEAMREWLGGGEVFRPSEILVEEYLTHWLDVYARVNCKATTVENYRKKIRLYILPAIGRYRLRALTPSTMQRLVNDLALRRLSRNTLAVVKGILTGSMDYAVVVDKYIQASPMVGVKLPSPRSEVGRAARRKERHAIDRATWDRIAARFPETTSAHVPLVLGYRCGLRLGEAFGLMWDDLDLDRGTLAVRRQVQAVGGAWMVKPPKYDSYRTITLDGATLALLRRERRRQQGYRLACGPWWHVVTLDGETLDTGTGEPVEPVCARSDGTWCSPRIMQHVGRVVHGMTGEPAISKDWDFHSLRHTHCSDLLTAGVPVKAVQKRLGHKNIETTLGVYAECTDGMRREAMDRIDRLYGGT